MMPTIADAVKNTGKELGDQILDNRSKHDEMAKKIAHLKAHINKIVMVLPSEIQIKCNVRSRIDEDSPDIERLCESIKKFGLMKNIVAELQFSQNEDSYELICIAGHRRLTALKKLGKMSERIPCLIKTFDDNHQGDKIGAALSENINREGLNVVDIANAYQALIKNGWNPETIALHFEKHKKTVTRHLRVAELPEDLKELFQNNADRFTPGIIFNQILAKNSTPGEIRKAAHRILSKKSTKPPSTKNRNHANLDESLLNYFIQEKVPNEEQSIVLKALRFLELIK
jgi:ParB/RepB/Spo0J family partition protein